MGLWQRMKDAYREDQERLARRDAAADDAPEVVAARGSSPPREEQVGAVEETVHRALVGGFATREHVDDMVDDLVRGEPERVPDLDEDAVAAVVDRVLAERRAVEAAWPDEGDAPRVQAAFDDLQRAGVVARMAFTCCNTCGHAEIVDEATPGDHGYVFFHQQDAERLEPTSSPLCLSYGALLAPGGLAAERDDADRAVAAEVVEALRGHGLDPQWGGSPEERVLVDVAWRRRTRIS